MRYTDFACLNENASCGASSSAGVATSVQPFFSSDPKETAARSIYAQVAPQKTKKKKGNKPVVIKRND
jgi:hypothetical protein